MAHPDGVPGRESDGALRKALAGLLGAAGDGEWSADGIADVLWLVRVTGLAAPPTGRTEPDPVAQRSDAEPGPKSSASASRTGGAQGSRAEAGKARRDRSSSDSRVRLFPPGEEPAASGTGGHVVRVAQPAALADALRLSRALRPLRQTVPVAGDAVLDEEATAHATGDAGGRLVPVWRPATGRRFSVDLVVDSGATMGVWHRLATELCTVLERHGAFSAVRCWSLDTDHTVPRLTPFRHRPAGLAPGGTPRWSRPLEDATGRAVLLVLTDGVGPAWYGDELPDFLAGVAGERPAAALQVLPRRLWHRTALRSVPVELRVPDPARPVAEVRTDAMRQLGLPGGQPPHDMRWLPVMEVDGSWLAPWAGLVAGRVPGWSAMLAAPLRGLPRPVGPDEGEAPPTDPAVLVARFRSGCSPAAFRLACHLAAAPLSLPVMLLVQRATMPESRQTDLAELFVSGLLRRLSDPGTASDPDDVIYDFAPGVRGELLAELTRTESLYVLEDVLAKVSGRVARTFGGTLDFRALAVLVEGSAPGLGGFPGRRLPAASLHFAEVAAAVLGGAGGRHRTLARLLAEAAAPAPAPATAPLPRLVRRPESAAGRAGEVVRAPARDTMSLRRARDRILAAARSRDGVRFDVVADSGCGKTLLLDEVASELREEGWLVLFITASAPRYGRGHDMAGEERAMADHAACRYLIDALAADVHRAWDPGDGEPPLVSEEVGRDWESAVLTARDAGTPDITLTITVPNPSDGVHLDDVGNVRGGAGGLAAGLRLGEMQRQLAGVLDAIARSRPLAILVDDTHQVLGTPVGGWLMRVLRGLPTAAVVHARRPEPDPGDLPAGTRRVVLGLLPRGETVDYVTRRLVDGGWSEGPARACAEEIASVTKGHPIGMVTCCEILLGSVPADTPVGVARERLLGGDAGWGSRGGFEAVRTFVQDHAERVLGRPVPLFDLLTVLRRCTPTILEALLAEHGVSAEESTRLYDWLHRSDLTTPFDDDVNEGWRLHDYLRENLARAFRDERPEEYAEQHAAVERHYRVHMNFENEPDELSPHAAGARFEDPDWQRDSYEWLHHASHMPRREFDTSKRAMIRLFFEAFFWWDTEVPSSYCGRLVANYRSLPADLDLRWVEWLDAFRLNYVAGRVNQRPGADGERWDRAASALEAVTGYLGIRRGRVPEDPDLRRLYILLNIFRGDASWCAGGGTETDRGRAAALYRAAADACTRDEERWIGNWASWLEADLYASTEPHVARGLLTGIEERMTEEEDNELPIRVARTFGDIAWAEGDLRAAFDCYARSVLRGYVYHTRQEVYGQYPSRYTVSLYDTARRWIPHRAEEASRAGRGNETAAAQGRVRALFAPYWAHCGIEPDNAFGLPDGPAESDLGRDRTEFAATVDWVMLHLRDELEAPLTQPLPDPGE
ncbi:SAV_2336 N-terminal domain-related protein [Streptomyces polygonati]|uniref:SAV_2336 N-terminal domain-related protein n=1 Tax=Streptomyces polygonati TaxID=1617087 RepID=A0ABV8HJY5_9ACTN